MTPPSNQVEANTTAISEGAKLRFDYAWKWFAYHADQRVKMLNYMLIASSILATGIVAAFKEQMFWVAAVLCTLGSILAIIFRQLDKRNEVLIHVGEDVLGKAEYDALFGQKDFKPPSAHGSAVLYGILRRLWYEDDPRHLRLSELTGNQATDPLTPDPPVPGRKKSRWKGIWAGKHRACIPTIAELVASVFAAGSVYSLLVAVHSLLVGLGYVEPLRANSTGACDKTAAKEVGGGTSCVNPSEGPKLGASDDEPTLPALRIAVFPYVPNTQLVKKSIREDWAAVSNVPLEFDEWDGYSEDPPAELDVFEFDAIGLDYFVRNNLIAAIPGEVIESQDDIFDFAWQGAMSDGVLYGIPHWLCGYVLFYRAGDQEIQNVESLRDLAQVLGDGPADIPPQENKGLLIDLTGGTDCACLYVDAVEDSDGHYEFRPSLPAANALNETGLKSLQTLGRLAGEPQGSYEDSTNKKRPAWFSERRGRVLVGYSERLFYMSEDARANVHARSLPMGDGTNVNLYFMDMFGINPRVRGKRKDLAIKLMNIAAGCRTVLKTLLPDGNKPSQYLLPARKSVLSASRLRIEAPVYDDLAKLLMPEAQPHILRLGEGGRDWLKENKRKIRSLVYSASNSHADKSP